MHRLHHCILALVAPAAIALSAEEKPVAPRFELMETRVISRQPHYYLGWPMITLRKNGELMLVYSGGRDYHVCPFGRLDMMTSGDGGRTWTEPQVILDSALDDRGSSIIETGKGTILVTYISSLVYRKHMRDPARLLNEVFGDKVGEHLDRWNSADRKTTEEEKKAIAGEYGGRLLIRSTDGGETWSEPIPVPCFSPRGPIRLDDGRVCYVAGNGKIAGAWVSEDDGVTWEMVSQLPTRAGESHAVQTRDGTIVAHVREKKATPEGRLQYTIQTQSRDGGKTWSPARKVADGYPSHLLRLKDDALLMCYGYRYEPYGIRAKISRDNGDSWSDEIVLSSDGATWDLGYPSSAQLPDGSVVTVWYEVPANAKNAVIRQATWRLK